MNAFFQVAGLGLIAVGSLFLVAAAVSLFRLPDLFSRLHALTKADTAGLALIALGVGLLERDPRIALTLVLIVTLVAVSGATVGHLVARMQYVRKDQKETQR